ncbi:MAG: hypothetical protein V3V08_11475 [Nannocystaceae bacterium]
MLQTRLRSTACIVAVVIGSAANRVEAGPARAPETRPPDESMREAETLYRHGKAKFETAEYQEALLYWKRAYGLLPDTEAASVIRHPLVYNISEAEVQAYEVTRNIAHLRKARILLEDYLATHAALHGEGEDATAEPCRRESTPQGTQAQARLCRVSRRSGHPNGRDRATG